MPHIVALNALNLNYKPKTLLKNKKVQIAPLEEFSPNLEEFVLILLMCGKAYI